MRHVQHTMKSETTHIPSWLFAGWRHRIVLQDDLAFRDDSVVSRGGVAAAGPFAGRARRRFRSAQCDARFRIQPCPRPVSEYHVPSALPDPAGIPAGTSPLKRSRRKKSRRNFWRHGKLGCRLFPKWRGKRASFSVHIIYWNPLFRRIFPARFSRVDETRVCPTRYDLCIFSIANTIEIRSCRSADTPWTPITTASVFHGSCSEFSRSIWTILQDAFTNVCDREEESRRTESLSMLERLYERVSMREMVQKKWKERKIRFLWPYTKIVTERKERDRADDTYLYREKICKLYEFTRADIRAIRRTMCIYLYR